MDNKLDTIPIRSDNRRTSNRSDFPFLKLDREWIVKLTSFMTVIALVYVSYLPFLHIFSVLGIEKYQIFPILIFMILGLLLFSYIGQMLCGKIQFHKFNITALSLYMLFAIYTLISFLFTDGIQDDLFTLRTIILVNPIFMILAISCLQNKETVVKMLFVLSGVYLMFPILSIMHNIFPGVDYLKNVFTGTERYPYQNINTYLGLFSICNIKLLVSGKKYISLLGMILITISAIGMMFIGGRASLVALIVISLIYFFNETKPWSSKISSISKKVLLIFVLAALLVFFLDEIKELLNISSTWRRFIHLTEEGDSSLRILLFSNALDLFTSSTKTIILGAGINSFSYYMSWNPLLYPHNIVLELLAEYGVLGVIIFLMPVAYIIRLRKERLGSIYGNSVEENIIFLLFIYYLVIHLFTGGLRYSWVLMFYLFLLLPGRGDMKKYREKNAGESYAGH